MSTINTLLLPDSLRELVRVLGEPAAFRLVELHGGGRLIVPKSVTPGHRLIDDLGLKTFCDLVEHYGGGVIDLPKYDAVLRQLRHQRVRSLRGDGHTHDRIAVLTGFSRRWVIKILEDDGDLYAQSQADLFDDHDLAPDPVPKVRPDNSMPSANDPFRLSPRATRR